ncbi:H/ACA ribonucleoprotein complex non-core subunit NAF1-like [Myripristis murdjan]|uniref:H/ACA ribonucleoprotein complex non-core subunit NAF1 n=1 Tax=Myripristis murdjan TaxID=586833 RepID=A0A667ZUB4_9TELE|nr:H/ACA ribonucleoprotein complex non-core subunit NAF1-like [Myripristis murdjan]XP_029909123.1 H/ACA ribonucleoprotein complex non-core subunit NAF1-like [Myripristis murdjan]
MDDKLSEENGLSALTAEEEEMEVTLTQQTEGHTVSHGNAHTPDTHTHQEAEKADACTLSAVRTLCVESVCKEESEEDSSEDSDSDSSTSSSSSSSSPCVPVLAEEEEDDEGFSQPAPVKTRDEILLEELPEVEEVCVALPEDAQLQPVGTVSSILQQLVIIQSLKDTPPLTDDSIIFSSSRLALGKVFEVFGPVACPLYVLRFNSAEQISNKGLAVGQTVFYTPHIKEYTGYVLTQQLIQLKGSDASWKNDQEPPPEALDYSDDEQEQEAKKKKKQNAKKKRDSNITDTPAEITHSALQQRPHDIRGFPPRHTGAPFRHQDPRHKHTPFQHRQAPPRHTHTPPRHTHTTPRHTHIPPMYPPPPCPYPPPPPPHAFAPPNFPHYPPPPLPPPPSFCHPSFSSPPWPPHSIPAPLPFSNLPPPPPPPPPPQ